MNRKQAMNSVLTAMGLATAAGLVILAAPGASGRQVSGSSAGTNQLLKEGGLRESSARGGFRLLTTGDPRKVGPVVRRLWSEPVEVSAVTI